MRVIDVVKERLADAQDVDTVSTAEAEEFLLATVQWLLLPTAFKLADVAVEVFPGLEEAAPRPDVPWFERSVIPSKGIEVKGVEVEAPSRKAPPAVPVPVPAPAPSPLLGAPLEARPVDYDGDDEEPDYYIPDAAEPPALEAPAPPALPATAVAGVSPEVLTMLQTIMASLQNGTTGGTPMGPSPTASSALQRARALLGPMWRDSEPYAPGLSVYPHDTKVAAYYAGKGAKRVAITVPTIRRERHPGWPREVVAYITPRGVAAPSQEVLGPTHVVDLTDDYDLHVASDFDTRPAAKGLVLPSGDSVQDVLESRRTARRAASEVHREAARRAAQAGAGADELAAGHR